MKTAKINELQDEVEKLKTENEELRRYIDEIETRIATGEVEFEPGRVIDIAGQITNVFEDMETKTGLEHNVVMNMLMELASYLSIYANMNYADDFEEDE